MRTRTFAKTAASSAALLLLLAACGEDAPDTVSADGGGTGNDNSTQTTGGTRTPARIRIAAGGSPTAAPMASAEIAADAAARDEDAAIDGGVGAKMAPWYTSITYVAGDALADLTGARPSWFFPADGYVVSADQKAAIAAAFGITGEWTALPADWGGGEAVGPTDGTSPNVTISADAMRSWWFNPAYVGTSMAEPCVTSKDATTGEERTECPTPTPPANVPDKATAEASAIALFASLGYDTSQFQYETYADEWGAWTTAWLTLDGQRVPATLYAGFGENGAMTGAGGFFAQPVQGDQYELVGVIKAIERLNDQQFGWMGLGSDLARSSTGGDVAVAAVDTDAADAVDTDADDAGGGSDGSTGASEPPATDAVLTDPMPTDIEPMPVQPCEALVRPAAGTDIAPAVEDDVANCEPVDVEPITVTLVDVKSDLTMVWDADGNVWLLPAYTFTASDGGVYTVIAIDDQFIELPEATPMPEPLPVEPEPAPIVVDEGTANTLVGLGEDEAVKLAESYGWQVRVVERDGESFPATADYRTDRVNLTIGNSIVTLVTIG